MAASPDKEVVKFGTAAGKFKYISGDLEGTDKDIQQLFYGKDWK